MKVCTKCQRELPLTEYSNSQRGALGLRSDCKSCVRVYQREHRAKNKERINQRVARNRESRREHIRAQSMASYRKHAARINSERREKYKTKRDREGLPKKNITLRSMMTRLDAVFSKYIRTKYSDPSGLVRCFTCSNVRPIPEMDCGHFVVRQHKSLRWSEENCHPQCRYCNRYNEGSKDVYAVRLIEKYGQGILEKLQTEKRAVVHVNQVWVLEQIDAWKIKLAALLAERKVISDAYASLVTETA